MDGKQKSAPPTLANWQGADFRVGSGITRGDKAKDLRIVTHVRSCTTRRIDGRDKSTAR